MLVSFYTALMYFVNLHNDWLLVCVGILKLFTKVETNQGNCASAYCLDPVPIHCNVQWDVLSSTCCHGNRWILKIV